MSIPPRDVLPDSETQEMSRSRESFIGVYRVEVKLGDGGMGVVYKCYDAKLKRYVALKVLKEKFAHDRQYRERLHREAQAIASISHPQIAQIYAIEDGDPGSSPYLVMEYIDGPSAESLLTSEGKLPPARAIRIARGAAAGLKAAAEKGIIHRDIKPSNILLTSDGSVKIVDFGLAKILETSPPITDDGIVLGTPHYISPEQGRGEKADARSDIYSLGATLYHLVTGRPPFQGESQAGLIVAHLNETPLPPHRIHPEVPEALSQAIGRMMAKEPARRYPGYAELIEDLDRLLGGDKPEARTQAEGSATFRRPRRKAPRAFWWGAAGAVAAAVALTLFVAIKLLPPPAGDAAALNRLRGWVRHFDDRTDCLEMTFQTPPAGLSRSEALGAVFAVDPLDGERITLGAQGLEIKDQERPLAVRFPLARLDKLRLQRLRLDGTLDFAVALVHPNSAQVRSLRFALRVVQAGSPGGGARSGRAAAEAGLEAVLAERNGEPVEIVPPPPAFPVIPPGTYDLEISLQPDGKATRVHLVARRSGSRAAPVYSSDPGEGVRIAGSEWNRGVLCLWASSPIGRGSASLEKLTAVGLLEKGPELRESPWRAPPGPDRSAGKADGKFGDGKIGDGKTDVKTDIQPEGGPDGKVDHGETDRR